MLESLVDTILWLCGKDFPTHSRYSYGNQLCPSSSRHISLLIWSRIYKSLLSSGRKQLASRFNFTYMYIDGVLSINNQQEFENYLGQMYLVELEIKDTTESTISASYPDLLLSIGRDGQLHTFIYDKRDDFNFLIKNVPFMSSNISASPAYGVFISQLLLYAWACKSYGCFILRVTRLSNKLHEQGHIKERLKSSLKKCYGRYRGVLSTIWSSSLTNAQWHSVARPNTMTTLLRSDFIPIRDLCFFFYQTRPFTDLWKVSIEHLRVL